MIRYEVNTKRGCGYRKIGGLYLVSDGIGMVCHRLPIPLTVCPVCSAGLKYSRGYTWIEPRHLLGFCDTTEVVVLPCHSINCAVCFPPEGRHGLLWVGKKFYSPDSFLKEAQQMGISKRINTVPRGFKIGETWIYLAHLEANSNTEFDTESGEMVTKHTPGIFYAFKPVRIEKIITEETAKNTEEIEHLEKQGLTPVVVENTPEHQGTVYDKII